MANINRTRVRSPYSLEWYFATGFDTDGKPIMPDGSKGTHIRNGVARVFDRTGVQRIVAPGMPAIDHTYNATTGLWEPDGVVLEDTIDNVVPRSCEFSHANWAKTNVTVTADNAIAPDGTLTADLLTATSANGTVIQDLGAVGGNLGGMWLRRAAGADTVQITMDGGANWTTVTVSSLLWLRCEKAQTVAAVDIGIRLVASGDAVWAWNAMVTVGAYGRLSTDIVTTTVAATRAASSLTLPFNRLPGALTVLVDWTNRGTSMRIGDLAGVFMIGDATAGADQLSVRTGFTNPELDAVHNANGNLQSASLARPAVGDKVLTRLAIAADGSFTFGQSVNGGAEVTAAGAALAHAAAFGAATLTLNNYVGGTNGFAAFRRVLAAAGVRTQAQMLGGLF